MKNDGKDFWDKALENLYHYLCVFIGAVTVVGSTIGVIWLMIENSKLAFWGIVILLILLFVNRKEIAQLLFERTGKNKEKEMSDKTLELARKLRFENAPKYLSEKQEDKLNLFWYGVNTVVNKIPIYVVNDSTPFTKEELYTLLFLNKESVEIQGKTVTNAIVTITARWNNDKVEVLNEKELKKHEPIHCTSVVTKKPVSKQVKEQRKLRKLKAEAKAKGMIVKNGKLYQTPNYTFLANEWVLNNIGLINKIIVDNDTPSSLVIKGTIFADKLPVDKAVWRYIGKNLVETDNIDNFSIQKNGIQVVINK